MGGAVLYTWGRGYGARPVATGGGKFEPPLGCAVPFAVTIGIEVYPPPGILSAPPANDTWLRRCMGQGTRLGAGYTPNRLLGYAPVAMF